MFSSSTVEKYLNEFITNFHSQKYFLLNNYFNFLFLCGANQKPNVLSARRKAVLSFIKNNTVNWHVVIAEKVFNSIENLKDINALDLEHYITDFSDFVLIIMESQSAFAELGAFSHSNLRKKVLVINNQKYRTEPSFINTGPIEAIVRSGSKENLMLYDMREETTKILDGIGKLFPDIAKHLDSIKIRAKISKKTLGLLDKVNKENLFLLHDIILIFPCITRTEIIVLLKRLFGNRNFKNLSLYLSILYGIEFITYHEKNGETFYSSTYTKTIINLNVNPKLLASARIFSQKSGRL